MKRPHIRLDLTDQQVLVVALLLIVLLAGSLLYCLGFASLALHQVWERVSMPWTSSTPSVLPEPSPTPLPSLFTTPL